MVRRWTSAVCALLVIAVMAGCATRKEKLLPTGDATMLEIWNQYTGGPGTGSTRALPDTRQVLRRPLTGVEATSSFAANEPYTRTADNEIAAQFRRLPNPDLLMYVFAHLAGTEQVPVPGYSTVFPLHSRVQYALPGERTEDY